MLVAEVGPCVGCRGTGEDAYGIRCYVCQGQKYQIVGPILEAKPGITQYGWNCRSCGGDHGGPPCDNPDIPIIAEYVELVEYGGEEAN